MRDVLRGIDEELRKEWPCRRIKTCRGDPMALVTNVHRLAEPANAPADA